LARRKDLQRERPATPQTIIVPKMMSGLAISEPYALRIRGDRCIPHPKDNH
jgi:hypothetical protein